MKKKILLMFVLLICLFLCACGKSIEAKNVETLITSLNEDSTYEDIQDAYQAYSELEDEEREKIANKDILSEVCEPSTGHLVLTDEMIKEIQTKLTTELDSITTKVEFAYYLNQLQASKGWNSWKDISVSSHKQKDVYSYVAYGTVMVVDSDGKESTRDMELEYFAEYDGVSKVYRISGELFVSED